MQFSDLKKVSSFSSESKPVHKLTVEVVITEMRYFGKRIDENMRKWELVDVNSSDYANCYDLVKSNLESYAMAFMDLVPVFAYSVDSSTQALTSLRSCIRYFLSTYSGFSDDCKHWIEFLQIRNDLAHRYYNHEFLCEETAKVSFNYREGVMELVDFCQKIIDDNNLKDVQIRLENGV